MSQPPLGEADLLARKIYLYTVGGAVLYVLAVLVYVLS
jgi:hypothetical protein